MPYTSTISSTRGRGGHDTKTKMEHGYNLDDKPPLVLGVSFHSGEKGRRAGRRDGRVEEWGYGRVCLEWYDVADGGGLLDSGI